MAKIFVRYFCCFLYLVTTVYSFSVFVNPLGPEIGNNGLFKNIFRNLRHMINIDEDILPPKFPDNNITSELPSEQDEPQNVFESDRILTLPNGGEKIEKLIEKEYFDRTFSKRDMRRELTELYKFPNHTFKMIKKHGMNLTETEERKIDCIENEDCNTTAYCLKDSYICQACHKESQLCTQSFQCCPGSMCDPFENVCKRDEKTNQVCTVSSECPSGHCCTINDDGQAVCEPYLKEGEDCSSDPFEFLSSNTFTNLPNKCSCLPGLTCRRKLSFPFHIPETCEKRWVSNIKNSFKKMLSKLRHHNTRPRSKWQFHDEDDLASLPIPGFPELKTSFQQILKTLNHHDDTRTQTTTTTVTPKPNQRKITTERKTKNPPKSIFDEKIRFNPFGFSPKLHHSFVDDDKSLMSTDLDKNDDSDEEDILDGYNIDQKELLDSVNDDNDASDDVSDNDFYLNVGEKRHHSHTDVDEKERLDDVDLGKKQNDHKRKPAEKINEKARQVTHRIVDGIFDSIMKGVIQSMKYQA